VRSVPVASQRLIFGGRELLDHQTLQFYGLEEGRTIHLVIRRNANPANPQSTSDPEAPFAENAPLLHHPDQSNDIPPEDDQLPVDVMDLVRACRLIRLFAIIDTILLILFAFWGSLIFLAGVPLAICGYFGAKNLKRWCLLVYALFTLLSVAFRVYLAYIYDTWLMIVVTALSVCLELYIFKQTINVYSVIPRLNPDDVRMLHNIMEVNVFW